jgi:hypothetical protein
LAVILYYIDRVGAFGRDIIYYIRLYR